MKQQVIEHHRFRAMGSEIQIWLELADAKRAKQLLRQAESIFTREEERLSRFRKESELSQLNRSQKRWVAVSPPLFALLQEAVRLMSETDRLFNPTLLEALNGAGYDRDFSFLSKKGLGCGVEQVNPSYLAEAKLFGSAKVKRAGAGSAGYQLADQIKFNKEQRSVYLAEGVQIDLGGIGKGATAQKVVAFLQEEGACLVDAAGDLVAGAAPQSFGFLGWPVGVNVPGDEEGVSLLSLWLAEGSLATSGVDRRCWEKDGCRAHHIIDPRTGLPAATDLMTVSILASEGVVAEGWATAVLVAGRELGRTLMDKHDIAGILIGKDQRIELVNFPEQLIYANNCC